MRTFTRLVAVLALLGLAASANAEVRVVYDPDAPHVPREATTEIDTRGVAPVPATELYLPYYEVDTSNANGLTTLYAVRNNFTTPQQLLVLIADDQGNSTFESPILAPRQTLTVNLRDRLPSNAGTLKGYVVIATVGTAAAIGGDYFYLDPANNFASGGALVDTADVNCTNWDTRFFNGGAFNGGTEFSFFTLFNGGTTDSVPIANGNVFTEAGTPMGTVSVFSNRVTSSTNSLNIPGLPTFGVVEWELEGPGLVLTTFDANGEYSVTVTPQCVDSFFTP